jgi:phage terminase small subunit
LTNVDIVTEIDRLTAAQSKRTEIDADYVLGNIKSIGEKCMKEDNKEPSALRAQELLGKHLKLFTEKHEHSGPDGGPIKTLNMTKEEYEKSRERMLKKDDC